MTAARIGAALYIVWGILHLGSGMVGIWLTGQPATPGWAMGMAAVPTVGSGLEKASLGLVGQHSFNIAAGGLIAILVAALGNWRNNRTAWWLNGALIAVLDLGMVIFMLLPGHVPLLDGLLGPLLWASGFALTTWAQRSADAHGALRAALLPGRPRQPRTLRPNRRTE